MRLRPLFALIAATGASVAVLIVGTGTAGAHGDEGEMTLTRFVQVGPVTVEVEVGIVYGGDGHLAEDAAVSATLAGPDGATVGPVELIRTGETTSLYAATVDVTAVGEWSVAVTSTDPTGTTSGTVTVIEGFAPTTSAPESPATTESPGTVAPAPVDAADDPDTTEGTAATRGDIGGGDGFPPRAVVAGSLALFALVIGGGVLVAWRRERAEAAADAVDP
jgi:hypothetical protein